MKRVNKSKEYKEKKSDILLKEIANIYFEYRKKIMDMEDQSGISSISLDSINNQRHGTYHLMEALASDNEERKIEELHSAKEHFEAMGIDAYEHIAESWLEMINERILSDYKFDQSSEKNYLTAKDYYDKGEINKHTNPEQSFEYFKISIINSIEAFKGLIKIREWVRLSYIITLFSLIISILLLLVSTFFLTRLQWGFLKGIIELLLAIGTISISTRIKENKYKIFYYILCTIFFILGVYDLYTFGG